MILSTSPLGGKGTEPQDTTYTQTNTSLDIDIRDKPKQTQSGACEGRQKGSSAISDLDEFAFKEEDYLAIDYELVIYAAKSTTAR
jgi:hypothetical protein